LILVDLQNDFLPGGPLAVPGGDQVVPVANRLAARFELVVATQDWHPADHLSFASQHPGMRSGQVLAIDGLQQRLWPDHCVQGTRGAALAADLDRSRIERVFRKGTNRSIDSYSGFFDNGRRRATGLADFLGDRGVDTVYVMGLATDYCVKFTALDACQIGLATAVVVDGCRGIDHAVGDSQRALDTLRRAGVRTVESSQCAVPG